MASETDPPRRGRRRIEPTLPLDLPRAERPAPAAGLAARAKTAEPPATGDLFDRAEARPIAEPPPSEPETADSPDPAPGLPRAVLAADEVSLRAVDPRAFLPTDRNDSWLYWLTDRARAADALANGVSLADDGAIMLVERRAVAARLTLLAEDPDFLPGAMAVLRLRRLAVEALLQPGPEKGAYVLAAEANVSA